MVGNSVASFVSSRYIGYFVIVVFVLLKIQHLDYPFYWDESWPYASAVHTMFHNGPSLMPGTIPAELSRGHPTLFIFLVAVWMKVFGTSLIAIHSFPLFISALFGISIYEIVRKLFDAQAAFAALILTLFQLLFFVQSSFILLEIMLAFVSFLCFYAYAKNRLVVLSILLLSVFFVKETAVVVGLALGIMSIIRWANGGINTKQFLKHLIVFAVPILGYMVFFALQKQIEGWYLFPFHMDLVDYSFGAVKGKLKEGLRLLFWMDGRKYLLFFAGTGTAYFIWKFKEQMQLQSFRHLWKQPWSNRQLFIGSILVFLPLILLFNSLNFYINRYFIIIIVPINVLFVGWVSLISKRIGSWYYYVSLPLILLVTIVTFWKPKELGKDEYAAFDEMRVEQEMISFLESNYDATTTIASNAYLLRMQLTDSNNRYLQIPKVFTAVDWEITDKTKLAVFSNKEFDYQYEKVQSSSQFQLLKRFEKGKVWAEVYRRK